MNEIFSSAFLWKKIFDTLADKQHADNYAKLPSVIQGFRTKMRDIFNCRCVCREWKTAIDRMFMDYFIDILREIYIPTFQLYSISKEICPFSLWHTSKFVIERTIDNAQYTFAERTRISPGGQWGLQIAESQIDIICKWLAEGSPGGVAAPQCSSATREFSGVTDSKSAVSEFIFNCGIQSYDCTVSYLIGGQIVNHIINTLTYIAKITTTRDAAFKIHAHVGLICATILAEYKIAGVIALPFDNLLQRYKITCISRTDESESCATIILA